jgi:uncharacterized protein
MATLVNPFFFESPSDETGFTDRAELLPRLTQLMTEQGRRALVHGRRRMGKTSLIRHAARLSKKTFIYCDVSIPASLTELAKHLLAGVPKPDISQVGRMLKIANRRLKSVAVTAKNILSLVAEIRPDDAEKTLEDVLNTLNDLAADQDDIWTICLDEFQMIRRLGGDGIDWKLRGIMQDHRNLTYIFSGSDQRLIEWMTAADAPFFKQLQHIDVGPIESTHLATWLRKRSARGGLPAFPWAEAVISTAGPCTGDVVRLAHQVFGLAASGLKGNLVAQGFDRIALEELKAPFLEKWGELYPPQRSVLRAVADGQSPSAEETLRRYNLRTASTATAAVRALVKTQTLVRTSGKLGFDNPFFKRWVEYNGAPVVSS